MTIITTRICIVYVRERDVHEARNAYACTKWEVLLGPVTVDYLCILTDRTR